MHQRLAVLGVAHRKLAPHAPRGKDARARGAAVCIAVAQAGKKREDFALRAKPHLFQRLAPGVKRLRLGALGQHDLVTVEEDMEIFDRRRVPRHVDTVDLQ